MNNMEQENMVKWLVGATIIKAAEAVIVGSSGKLTDNKIIYLISCGVTVFHQKY